MDIDEVLILVIRSVFSYLMRSIEFVSQHYCIFIVNISILKQRLVIVCGFGCLVEFLRRLSCNFVVAIL